METIDEVPEGRSTISISSHPTEPIALLTIVDPDAGNVASIALDQRGMLLLRAALARKARRAAAVQMAKAAAPASPDTSQEGGSDG